MVAVRREPAVGGLRRKAHSVDVFPEPLILATLGCFTIVQWSCLVLRYDVVSETIFHQIVA